LVRGREAWAKEDGQGKRDRGGGRLVGWLGRWVEGENIERGGWAEEEKCERRKIDRWRGRERGWWAVGWGCCVVW